MNGEAPKLERNHEIIVLHAEGMEDATIAKQFGISRQRVHQIIVDAGFPTRLDMLRTQRGTIIEYVKEGYSAAEIAKLLDVPKSYVLSVTHKHGLTSNRRPKSERDLIETLLALHREGHSIYSLTQSNRSLRDKVYRYAAKKGIQI